MFRSYSTRIALIVVFSAVLIALHGPLGAAEDADADASATAASCSRFTLGAYGDGPVGDDAASGSDGSSVMGAIGSDAETSDGGGAVAGGGSDSGAAGSNATGGSSSASSDAASGAPAMGAAAEPEIACEEYADGSLLCNGMNCVQIDAEHVECDELGTVDLEGVEVTVLDLQTANPTLEAAGIGDEARVYEGEDLFIMTHDPSWRCEPKGERELICAKSGREMRCAVTAIHTDGSVDLECREGDRVLECLLDSESVIHCP